MSNHLVFQSLPSKEGWVMTGRRRVQNYGFKFLFCAVLWLCSLAVHAQTTDSLAIYKKIKKGAYHYKFTRFLFHAVFVDPYPIVYKKKKLSDKQRKQIKNSDENGKIIRHISVEVYDPFGYSVNDTALININSIQKIGNRVHTSTRGFVIKNLLLFDENDTVDMYIITESERLLRKADYITDAKIYFIKIPHNDSVDIRVVIQDKWRMNARLTVSTTNTKISLNDGNLLGWGHSLENNTTYLLKENEYKFDGKYRVNSFGNSYIAGELYYLTNKHETVTGFDFSRPFYSPVVKWAGGVAAVRNGSYFLYTNPVSLTEEKYGLNYYQYDVWAGRTLGKPIKISKKRQSNIIATIRHTSTYYTLRPSFSIDINKVNTNLKVLLGGIGISIREYYKDQFIFRFGANEDIPEGWLMQAMGGITRHETKGTGYYTGFELSRGGHLEKLGYLSGNMAIGSSFYPLKKANSTFTTGLLYFSDIYQNRFSYFRQFIYYKLIYGFNKEHFDVISFDGNELYGLRLPVSGISKMVLNFESVFYTYYNLIGFKFAPVALVGLGLIGNHQRSLLASPLYQSYAIGVLIRNENLLTSSFQVSVGFYPPMPQGANSWIMFNPFANFTLRIRDFAIGKPEIVGFR